MLKNLDIFLVDVEVELEIRRSDSRNFTNFVEVVVSLLSM